MSYYLGLDLATVQTGWAIARVEQKKILEVKKGTITFSRSLSRSKRLKGLGESIKDLVERYEVEPILIKEQPLHDQSRRISGTLFMAHGVVEFLFSNFEFEDVNPVEVKKFVTGYGHASKQEVQKKVCEMLNVPMEFGSLDESDAMSILVKGLWNRSLVNDFSLKR
ncbi:crossover junction endodeoxyribonuclease RuvC [Bacillaceae bacterium S4-13-58]